MTARTWVSPDIEIIVPTRRDDVVVEAFDDDLVFSHPRTGVIVHLNPAAIEIWERCDGVTTIDDIIAHLARGDDVDAETVRDDVEQVIVALAELGFFRDLAEPQATAPC
ncbi:MAG: PqqD family protein [Planctomycetota bacterium]|jgi:hypothetical protein